MKVKLNVNLQDGTSKEVTASDADLIALEEQFDIDATVLQSRQRLVWMAFLAWSALNRTGQTAQTWDEWKTKSFGEIDMNNEGQPGNA